MGSSQSKAPSVTIGLPVYNGEAYLEEALRSLVTQTYPDIEIIVSDNASTDRTMEICRDFAAQDRRVRFLRNPQNIGATANYNRLVDEARGVYFKWAAHDDNCRPDFVAACITALDAEPSAVLCYPSTLVIDGQGVIVSKYRDGIDLRDPDPAERLRCYLRRNFIRAKGMCNPIFGLCRTTLLRRTRLIQNFIGSDRTLLAHLALLGDVIELPLFLFERRVHAQTSTMADSRFSSRASWFSANGSRHKRTGFEFNNHLALRLRQIGDIARAIDELVDNPRVRHQCKRILWLELATDPKWIYKDIKYSLGFQPAIDNIIKDIFVR